VSSESAGAPARRGGAVPRVLVLAESLPYPTVKGGDLRTWQHVNLLASFASVAVFGLCSNDRRRLVVPDVPLAGWAASTDPTLTSPPPKGVTIAARAWLLDPAGHPSDLYFSDGAARELSSLLARFRPDVVVVEGLWLHRYIEVVRAAGCRVVLDCHNVEAAIFRALAATSTRADLEGRVVRDVLPGRTEVIERRAIGAVNQVWVCSDEDARLMRDLYDSPTPVVVVPNGIQPEAYDAGRVGPPRPSAGRSLTLLFPGIFAYLPNAFAAAFLVEEIFPQLAAACAACRVLLVGPMPAPDLVAAAARDARLVVTGAVPDVRPYLAEATAMAVPLFHGGGTHLKVLEAFAAGLPVISTAKGAEGLDVHDGVHLLIAESAGEFVDAAMAMWRDPRLAERLAMNARAAVVERFSWATIGAHVRRAIGALGC
jgi:glycosyltransferase involved in cell wall biosynthesis